MIKTPQRGFLNFLVAAIVAVVVVVVVDVVSCQFNLLFYCDGTPRSTNTGGSNDTPTRPVQNPRGPNNNTQNNSNTNTQGGANNACTSAPNPICGITNQGVRVNGVCNATTPPNSACPAPLIDPDRGFYADPALVRSGSNTNLRWNVTRATVCSITGGGLSLSNLGITGATITNPIESKTIYTLTCTQGVGGSSTSVNTTVNLVPSVQEI